MNGPEHPSCEQCGSSLLRTDVVSASAGASVPAPDPLAPPDPLTPDPQGHDPLTPDPLAPPDPLTPDPQGHEDSPLLPVAVGAVAAEPFAHTIADGESLHSEMTGLRTSAVDADAPLIVIPRFSELGTTPKRILLAACAIALSIGGFAIYTNLAGDETSPKPDDLAFSEPSTTVAPTVTGVSGADLEAMQAAVFAVDVSSCGVETSGAAFAIDEHHLLLPASVALDVAPSITLTDGTTVETTVVGVSDAPDVAVLNVTDPLGSVMPLGSAIGLNEGDEVTVLRPPTSPDSIVESTVVAFRSGWIGPHHGFVIAAELDPMSSGSPVVDANGQLVGIATWLTGGPHADSMVVIGIDELLDTAAALVEEGSAEAQCVRSSAVPAPSRTWGDPSFGTESVALGSDPALDSLASRCRSGEPSACDDLAMVSWNSGSEYWSLGLTCGDTETPSIRFCVQRLGTDTFRPQETHRAGECLILPRTPLASFRTTPCDVAHDAEVFYAADYEGELDYLTAQVAPTTTTTAPAAPDEGATVEPFELDIPTTPSASVSNRAIVDPGMPGTAIAEIERRCQIVFDEIIVSEHWDAPFELGVILPDGDVSSNPYACFVHRPGAVLSQGYVAG